MLQTIANFVSISHLLPGSLTRDKNFILGYSRIFVNFVMTATRLG